MDIFNDIQIKQYDSNDNVVDTISVPIMFGTKEKAYQRIKQLQADANATQPLFPVLVTTLQGIELDTEKMAGRFERRVLNITYENDVATSYSVDYNPIPYKLNLTLNIGGRYITNMFQILENILPNFTPCASKRIKERTFNLERDCNIVLESVNIEVPEEFSPEDQRLFAWWSLDFTMDIVLYKPLKTVYPITSITTNVYCHSTSSTEGNTITITGEKLATGMVSTTADIGVLGE